MKNVACGLLLLAVLPLAGGCAAALAGGAGAGTVAYIKGELQANLEAPLGATLGATKRAVTKLDFVMISAAADRLAGEVVARTAQDEKITIALERVTSRVTQVSIRVGMFGDQTLSQVLMDEIKRQLGV
jgi:hypothetical protein